MKRLIAAAALAAILIAAPAEPVAWKLQNEANAPVKPGARFQVKLLAKVQEGWHLYSMKPMAEGPIATRIWIADGQPFSLAGGVQAPDPQVIQDPTLGMEVELYEGEALFTLPVKIAPTATPGTHTLVVSAAYQSCNDKLCLPPKTVKVELPVNVGK
jgi:DsbC/DsbD-like thiol-disulfide interchange protein